MTQESRFIEKYIDALKDLSEKDARDGFHFVSGDELAIEQEFGEMLYSEIKNSLPKRIVELGTGYGYSTSWMLLASTFCDNANVYTVDKENRSPKVWHRVNITNDFPVNLHCFIGDFRKIDIFNNIDFLFHDSEHKIEKITEDLDYFIPRMSPKSQIWIHDANGATGKGLKDYFKSKEDWKYEQIDKSWGMGIAKRYDRSR
jgi:predicted O-methyltransferase YrrM